MAKPDETYVLAEMRTIDLANGAKGEVIRTVVRSYYSMQRAEQDMALMKQALPDIDYRVLSIEHIDN